MRILVFDEYFVVGTPANQDELHHMLNALPVDWREYYQSCLMRRGASADDIQLITISADHISFSIAGGYVIAFPLLEAL